MQDNNLPNNQANPSHVDDYQPPSSDPQASGQPFGVPVAPQMNVNSDDSSTNPGYTNTNDLNQSDTDEERLDEPVVLDTLDNDSQQDDSAPLSNQSLETQNIFDLLGVNDGKDDEKEAFLDELQEVIWEDFIENDVELLLNEEQLKELREIEAKGQTREVQEEMLVYLEELLPDLEDIMMDKALELKEDMVLERISGMKEFYSGNQSALDQISRSEGLISENKWADAGSLLNSIK
jgi:hypothetical protein